MKGLTYRVHKRAPLSQDEANKLASACKMGLERLIVWTLLDTGLRVEEFCALTPSNILWQEHTLVVYGKNTTGTGGKKRRQVPMSDRVRPLLEGYFATNDEIGYTTRHVNRLVHGIANRARISQKCSPHVLRHTFAVHSLQRGVSLPALQKVLGHEDLKTTAIYLNLSNEESLREYREKW